MKNIKIYTLQSQDAMVVSGQEYYEVHHFTQKPIPVWNSDEVVAITEAIIQERWLIEKWSWPDQDLYIAFDPEIREILQIDKEQQEKLEWVNKKLMKENIDLQSRLEEFHRTATMYVTMSFWERLKFLFRG